MPILPQGLRKPQTDPTSDQTGFFENDSWLTPDLTPLWVANSAASAAQPAAAPAADQSAAIALYGNFCSVAATVTTSSTSTATKTAAPTTSTATVAATTTTKTTVPAWVNTLTNAQIKADMTAAITNGTVTYAGLLKVFTDVDASLAATKTKLSASQFADLKTIAANLNNGVSTSSYLTYITQAFVNGNAANATWTGGAASSVALGNLATGSTELQFAELIGKWFLGTDLPSSKVVLGSTQFSVSDSNVTKPLFATGGASLNDIN
ncbi:MAG: peptidase C2, partial [Bradyrhizobium sp.]|nr:peptidase C2 [Bradyrhizobium sp.]